MNRQVQNKKQKTTTKRKSNMLMLNVIRIHWQTKTDLKILSKNKNLKLRN